MVHTSILLRLSPPGQWSDRPNQHLPQWRHFYLFSVLPKFSWTQCFLKILNYCRALLAWKPFCFFQVTWHVSILCNHLFILKSRPQWEIEFPSQCQKPLSSPKNWWHYVIVELHLCLGYGKICIILSVSVIHHHSGYSNLAPGERGAFLSSPSPMPDLIINRYLIENLPDHCNRSPYAQIKHI